MGTSSESSESCASGPVDILCNTVQRQGHTQHNTVSSQYVHTRLYCVIRCCTALLPTVLLCTVLYCTVHHCTILYTIVIYCALYPTVWCAPYIVIRLVGDKTNQSRPVSL